MAFIYYFWMILCFSTLFKTVISSGTVEIRLLKFINSGGVGSNGHCCDGRGPFCFSDCDHMFKICVDNADGPDNMHSCPYFRQNSGEITNSNTVTFGSNIAGIKNPIKILFDSWPGELKLKVEAWDVDDNDHDHVDFLSGVFGLKASRSEHETAVAAFQIRKRTLLTYNVKVYCDKHFYGEYCDNYCNPTENNLGHYTCDTTTGMAICDEGWTGAFCDDNGINECLGSPCNENQTCVDTPSGYDCSCPDGFQGPSCEESVNASCIPDPCLNGGTCELLRGHIVCDCPTGYVGLICEIEFDMCADMNCQNGGTCLVKLSSIECVCPTGFSGVLCDHKVDHGILLTSTMTPNDLQFNESLILPNETLPLPIEHTGNANDTKEDVNITKTTPLFKILQTSTLSNVHTTITFTTAETTTATTTTVPTTTTEAHTYPTLTVRGRVDRNNRESVGKGLRDLIYELVSIRDQLYLDIKYKVKKTSEGDIVSEIIIESALDGSHAVNNSLVQHLFDDTPRSVIESHIHMPIVRQRPAKAHSHEPDLHASSWMHHYWYVVVILVFGVVCFIIAIGIVILYKRKKFSEPENKPEVPTNSTSVNQPVASSQSFENSLYFEVKKNNNKNSNNTDYTAMP